MTEEQIKQKAEEYAQHKWFYPSSTRSNWNIFLAWKEGFEDGAHSRDEEIEQLGNDYHDMFLTLANKVEQLRNPWISVEDRLPEEGECVFVRYGDVTHSLYSSAYMIEKNLWSIEGYGNGEVTHWMPIPKL